MGRLVPHLVPREGEVVHFEGIHLHEDLPDALGCVCVHQHPEEPLPRPGPVNPFQCTGGSWGEEHMNSVFS